jgi:serine/threonine protein kinase
VAAELPLGSVFAGCRIEEVIGQGEMGIVYRADELALQRPVAIKVVRPEYSQEERFRERFRRESQVVASIDHPNVIPLFKTGEEDGVLFITMRLVEGTDLKALIAAEGRVDPMRTARIVRKVGGALDAAHARGLVHRDVKPANVLLARADHAYLSDFGLAKHADSLEELTRQGTVVARAGYVSPEQIKGEGLDARADVYALGCLLFEALTGEAPFAKDKEKGEGAALMAHVEAPPPSAAELVPGLPPEFDEVVRRAMAKDPGERYPSAGDLGEAALVAAEELRRAGAEPAVATGGAAPAPAGAKPARPARPPARPPEPAPSPGLAPRADPLRWGIAIAVLVLLAVCMFVALGAIQDL